MEQVKINAFRMLAIAKSAKIDGGYFDAKPDAFGHYDSIFVDFKNETFFILPPYINDNFSSLNHEFEFLGDLSNSTRAIKTIAQGLVDSWGYHEEKSPLKNQKYNYQY